MFKYVEFIGFLAVQEAGMETRVRFPSPAPFCPLPAKQRHQLPVGALASCFENLQNDDILASRFGRNFEFHDMGYTSPLSGMYQLSSPTYYDSDEAPDTLCASAMGLSWITAYAVACAILPIIKEL
jgi:hypothetical protein